MNTYYATITVQHGITRLVGYWATIRSDTLLHATGSWSSTVGDHHDVVPTRITGAGLYVDVTVEPGPKDVVAVIHHTSGRDEIVQGPRLEVADVMKRDPGSHAHAIGDLDAYGRGPARIECDRPSCTGEAIQRTRD